VKAIFVNLKWGTQDPVAFKDSELGLIRLRAFGAFNIQTFRNPLILNNFPMISPAGMSVSFPLYVQTAGGT